MKNPTHPFTFMFILVIVFSMTPAARAIIAGETLQIFGQIKDNLGNPVADVDVAGDDYVGDVYPARTDANGHYAIDVKGEGNYQVTVSCVQLTALGYDCAPPGAVTITSGSTELNFTVHPATLPLVITNTFLPEGGAGAIYKIQFGAQGGRPPYKWQFAMDSTNMPAGLVLNSRGLLSGMPMTNSASTINVQVTDSNSTVTNKVLFIMINPGTTSFVSPDLKGR